jgi:hypothetical protein
MLQEELDLHNAIDEFIRSPQISVDELFDFLLEWAAHPDSFTDYTTRVIKNLSALNQQLLNELTPDKRFHLVKALCVGVKIALSLKQWEYMLGREDGAWYWNNLGLFFSSLHSLIPVLNTLQKHVSEIDQGFTGRIIYLEGPSEYSFLELLHFVTRLLYFDNYYFVYGGKGAQQNLVYHIRDKNDKGVRVDFSYDGDSNFSTQVMKLQNQVNISRIFRFERDFESAFPPEMLASALTAYLKRFKDVSSVVSTDEVKVLLTAQRPFVKAVEGRYSIEISKPTLGELLAMELVRLSESDDRVLQGEGLIANTELSRFLRFIMDWPEETSGSDNAQKNAHQ